MISIENNKNVNDPSPALGILLTNVGTPKEPTAKALKPYLKAFLSDQRVIDYPRWVWNPILFGIILNTRPRRSAKLYKNIWTNNGSPLLITLQNQSKKIKKQWEKRSSLPIQVEIGLRYGEPSIGSGLEKLRKSGVTHLVVFPLFPHNSSTTTTTSLDAVFEELRTWSQIPTLDTITHYHNHPSYIEALANSIQESWRQLGRSEKLLFSFHGIPERYVRNGDLYPIYCKETASLVAKKLGIIENSWETAFQSRFGPEEWVKPYTDKLLQYWGESGVKSVDVIAPGFSADCLETLDELNIEAREIFMSAGGETFHYIPSLNDRDDHIEALLDILEDNSNCLKQNAKNSSEPL